MENENKYFFNFALPPTYTYTYVGIGDLPKKMAPLCHISAEMKILKVSPIKSSIEDFFQYLNFVER